MFGRSVRQATLLQQQVRAFSGMTKLAKMELTLRTPYATLFKNCAGFQSLYVNTIEGQINIGNRSPPRVYLLPPGEIKVAGIQQGAEGNHSQSDDGKFMHTGGWLFVHENNSVEVNLLECCEKDQFKFDKINAETTETSSAAGQVATKLQHATFSTFQKKRQ